MGDIYRIREFGYLHKGMDMLLERQNVVASNIANVSTPGYKARSIEFEKRIDAAIGGRLAMKETNNRHLPNKLKGVYGVAPAYKVKLSGAREDGNTVNLDDQILKSTVNSTKHNALITVWSKHMRNILSSLRGG